MYADRRSRCVWTGCTCPRLHSGARLSTVPCTHTLPARKARRDHFFHNHRVRGLDIIYLKSSKHCTYRYMDVHAHTLYMHTNTNLQPHPTLPKLTFAPMKSQHVVLTAKSSKSSELQTRREQNPWAIRRGGLKIEPSRYHVMRCDDGQFFFESQLGKPRL